MKNWVVVASLDHIEAAIAGGFIQAGHGKKSAVERFSSGDRIICYASKKQFGLPEPCQEIITIGTVQEGEIYQAGLMDNADDTPYRRDVEYDKSLNRVKIRPLIDKLAFIKNPRHWGYPFRAGVFSIMDSDFEIIRTAMSE